MPENQQLKDAISCALHAVNTYSGQAVDILPWKFFSALVKLSEMRFQDGVDVDDVKFTPDEVYEEMQKFEMVKKIPDAEISKWLRRHFKALIGGKLEELEGFFKQIAVQQGLSAYPGVSADGSAGGRGKKTYYYLTAIEITEDNSAAEQEVLSYPIPENGIRYQEERSSLPFYSKLLREVDLVGWKRTIWLIVLLPPIIVFMLIGTAPTAFQHFEQFRAELVHFTLYGLIYLLAAWTVLHPFYRVIEKRAVLLPQWFAISSMDNVVLEWKVVKKNENPVKYKRIRLVTYSGNCPICNGRVTIHKGGVAFWGRLVGKCLESPTEHVFSFDHITRTGSRLRY